MRIRACWQQWRLGQKRVKILMMLGFSGMIYAMIFGSVLLLVYALLVLGETSLVMIRYGKVARATLEKLKCRKGLSK